MKKEKISFIEYLKRLRLNNLVIGCRRFAGLLNMKPSAYLDVEHGRAKFTQEQFKDARKLLAYSDAEKRKFTRLYKNSLKMN